MNEVGTAGVPENEVVDPEKMDPAAHIENLQKVVEHLTNIRNETAEKIKTDPQLARDLEGYVEQLDERIGEGEAKIADLREQNIETGPSANN